jgi:arylsulfatase
LLTRGRDEFTYYAGLVRITEGAAPDTKNKSWQIQAEVVIPKGGAEGMLLTHGGDQGITFNSTVKHAGCSTKLKP